LHKILSSQNFCFLIIVNMLFIGLFFYRPVHAQQPMPRESGFSGYLELFGAYTSSNSQLNAVNGNRSTDSLDQSGDRVGRVQPFPLGLISYTFADIRTQLYFGILPENVAEGQILFETGVRHNLTDGTILRASVLPVSPLDQETWEDPFVVGQDRDKTDVETWGLKFVADNIMGSGLNLRTGIIRRKINNERSGEFLFSRPGGLLTLDDLDDLERDSYDYRLTAQYSMRLAHRVRLLPIIRYVRGAADGDANSFHGLAPQLSLQYFSRQLQAALNATFNREWYDDEHPVFDKTRNDYSLGLFAIVGYRDPFGWKNFRIDWIGGASKQNSNIDFFESTNYLTGLGVGYIF